MTGSLPFAIEKTTGNIVVIRSLDREVQIPEDLPIGFVIGRVHAEDQDDGINGFLCYVFERGNDDLLFSIEQNTGLITLIGNLDFEKEEVHLLLVKVKDGGWIPKTGDISVIVAVKDVNDNPPVFLASEYTVSVPENSPVGTTVIQTKASDRDSGVNAEIIYSLLSGDKDTFAVDSKDGTITIQEMCDFEIQQEFEILVKASNTGSSAYFSELQSIKCKLMMKIPLYSGAIFFTASRVGTQTDPLLLIQSLG
uniref:Cadherin domain-containing protein n=1 Tax=Scleropages formosus TaxID=113540 RepID=A0A8C9T8C8_SCLFO